MVLKLKYYEMNGQHNEGHLIQSNISNRAWPFFIDLCSGRSSLQSTNGYERWL